MLPLYEDPSFTFRFAEDRIIPRFHLEGVEAGFQDRNRLWPCVGHDEQRPLRPVDVPRRLAAHRPVGSGKKSRRGHPSQL